MTALLSSLIGSYWQQIAGAAVALLGALGLYAKGRSDAKQKAKLDDIQSANTIRKEGADARAGAAVGPGRLRQSDGWKRD